MTKFQKVHVKTGDTVKLIAGAQKGTTGKVVGVDSKAGTVRIEGVNQLHRHVKPTQLNPYGGHKDIHVGVPASKVVKVKETKK